jgi:pimeloyl-ACP methyl ester carboxylesterase
MTSGETGELGSRGAPTLVFIHGSGNSGEAWGRVLPLLGGIPCVALDLPGHGAQFERPGPRVLSVADYADGVRSTLTRQGLEHVYVAGHSLGSAVALQLALTYPALVSRVVLMGAGARLRVLPSVLARARVAPVEALRELVLLGFAPGKELQAEAYFETLAPVAPGVIYRDLAACDGFDMMGDLGRIEQPTLILAGEADRLTPLKYAQYLAAHLERATLHLLPGTGHYVTVEAPAAVAETIREWLAAGAEP